MKQSVPTERVQGEFSASVNKGKEQVVAAGLRDEDDGYAVHSGREIWFSKCDSHRCKAIFQEGCKWFAYCHKMKREDTW
ncbi:hypothetical protein Ahy_B05g077224 [Arachis hypogaea]|uniref:Uncharacterized protein n=1 Tax=Arachis hypogaea TaxID=3818 RepID=A0A444Z4J0_ARAHY|nr:hypothetical protein Ahy_B05g077224 [Arachis hypogaea]